MDQRRPATGRSNRLEQVRLTVRKFHFDRIPGDDRSGALYDAHDPGLSDEAALGIALESRSHETLCDSVQLTAWIAKAGDLDDRFSTDRQPCAPRQGEEIDAPGRDVLTDLTRCQLEPGFAKLSEQLLVYQVNLSKVGSVGIARNAGAVLHLLSVVGIAQDAEANHETDARPIRLAHRVSGTTADGYDR